MPVKVPALAAALVLSLLALAPAGVRAAAPADFDPLKAYGNRIVFDVYRGDERIGQHVVSFTRQGGSLDVEARFNAEVEMLGMTVFRFDYHSSADWRDGRLLDLTANTNEDGDRRRVRVFRNDGDLVVRGPDGVKVAKDALPSNHWNPAAIHASQLINTLTGHIAQVRISPVGTERVDTNAGTVDAKRYRIDGDLRDVEVWYDGDGRWVKLRFREQGNLIDYRCVQCVNGMKVASE